MTDAKTPEGFSLRRWSRRKLEAAQEAAPAVAPPPAAPDAGLPAATAGSPAPAPLPADASALPPIESLTPESDFAAFMQPKVDDGLRRQALKKLFADPRFNVMDGLDVYIDDYTKPDPIAPDVLERLAQMGFVRDAGAIAEASPPSPARATAAPEAPSVAQPSEPALPATPAASADDSESPGDAAPAEEPPVPPPAR